MEDEGSVVVWRKLDEAEFAVELARKLEEELDESEKSAGLDRDKDLEELADVAEVYEALRNLPMDDDTYHLASAAASEIDAATDIWDIDLDELEEVRAAKNQRFGAFVNQIYVETVSVEESNPWMQRYLASPEKYPEVI